MLSNNDIKKAVASATGTRWITDSSEGYGKGTLVLKVSAGKKGTTAAWFVVWTVAGKINRHKIGNLGDVLPNEAREIYRNFDLADPSAERPTVGGTVQQLFTDYIDTLADRQARSVDQLRRILLTGQNAVAPLLGSEKQAGDVTPGDVVLILHQINAQGKKRMADATRTAINAAFNWAIQSRYDYTDKRARDWGITTNPVAVVTKDRSAKVARDRNLTAPELKAVWEYENLLAGDALRLIICCGQRVLETLRIEGRDVDLAAKVWTQPAEKTKGGTRSHAVPLPAAAIPILERLISQYGDGYLFPARGAKTCPHISLTSLNRVTKRIPGAEEFQARDLRRTWKSRAGDAGIPRDMRDRIQQHFKGDTGSKFYDRYDYAKEKREAMDSWQAWLDSNVTGSLHSDNS